MRPAIDDSDIARLCFNPRTPCGVRLGMGESLEESARFNPRTPCGVRLNATWRTMEGFRFQSTHSLRSATQFQTSTKRQTAVSIHALLAECDFGYRYRYYDFMVSIHALLAECDDAGFNRPDGRRGFNPRTPCGVRLRPTLYIATQQSKSYFAPTSLKRPSLHGCSF